MFVGDTKVDNLYLKWLECKKVNQIVTNGRYDDTLINWKN